MSELVYTRPELTGLAILGEVETCQSTHTGAVEIETYSAVSWLYRGTVPLTVTVSVQLVSRWPAYVLTVAPVIIVHRRTTSPLLSSAVILVIWYDFSYQHYGVRIWITRSNTMCEIQLARIEWSGIIRATNDFMNRDTHERVMLRRGTVVEVVRPFGGHCSRKRQKSGNLELHGHSSSPVTAR